ncbi:MAG: ZIP family transporter [Monoraphidium minutum]|nr:MAG: ZIP family transporter [Monoraphidium minutum]
MAELLARRALMGLGHLRKSAAADEHDHHDHDGHDHGGPMESTLDVRIIAIFAIAAGALLCGLPPLFLRAFQSADSPVSRVARAFSGGIILALALIHIVPEAVMELGEVIDFPIGGVTVLFGILMLVVADSSLTALWAPKDYKDRLRASLAAGGAAPSQPGGNGFGHKHHGHAHGPAIGADDAKDAKDVTSADDVLDQAPPPHTHSCTSSLTARGLGGAPGRVAGLKQRVTAYTMELGCIFHSVIIGVGMGVITDDRRLVIVLMVALIVHQGLEGLSLGTVLAVSPFSKIKKVAMLTLYALTTSIGIAIGIAVASTYDHDSVTSRAVQGTLNGVSGGMLLYISLFQLIAEEFSREDLLVRPRLRLGMTAGMLLGAACMCVLAIWS